MPPTRMDYRWGILGHSQLGASHSRQGLPNQDAIRFFILPDGSPPAILAVADGHGSAKSFRSDVGAALAVSTAEEVCRDFLEGIGDAAPSADSEGAASSKSSRRGSPSGDGGSPGRSGGAVPMGDCGWGFRT